MRLAAAEQQQHRHDNDNAQESSGQRQRFKMVEGTSKKQMLAAKPSKYTSGEQQKRAALKSKWHKIVEDLIDDQYPAQGKLGDGEFAVNQPIARKRALATSNQYPQPSTGASSLPDDDTKLMIVVKRKPDGNGLGDLFAGESQQQQQQQPQQQSRPPVNMEQHRLKIINDDFGILREAKITSNNHLGYKGMPKFGSDEQF